MSLRRNTLWNLVGTGLPFLLGIITIPYLIKNIGIEAFGVLTLVWALIGYFSLFDFGLGRALTQQVASSLAANDGERIPRLVKTGILFTVFTGVVGGLILSALSFQLGYDWLKVSGVLQTDTVHCLVVAAIGIPLTTITTGLRGVLEGYEDFKGVNILRIILGAANFGFPALSVMLYGPSLTAIVGTLIVARLVILVAHLLLVNKKLPKGWYKRKTTIKELKSLFSFGMWMTVSNIIGPLMVTADRFVISAVLGAATVAFYTVPSEALTRILIIPAALTGALFPRMSAKLRTEPKLAVKLYNDSLKIVSAILIPIVLVITVSSYWGLSMWLGKEFAENSWKIASILSFGLLFNGIAFVPFAAIQASGKAKITAKLHVAELIIYIPLLILLLYFYGLVGAVIAWVIRVAADLFFLLIYASEALNDRDMTVLDKY